MSFQIALPVDALEPAAGKDAVELLSALRIVADDAPAVTGTEVALVNLAGVLSFKTASGTFTIASLGSPAFTGTPSAPTAAPGTNTTQIATTAFVQAALAALIDSSPGALDTLNELAAALGDDANFATTMTNALAGKLAAASNLSDLASAASARTNLGLGTAATLDVGTTANKVVQLDGTGKLPVVDGSQLTNLPGGGSPITITATAWVDPVNGNNGTAAVGNPALPFQTMAAADTANATVLILTAGTHAGISRDGAINLRILGQGRDATNITLIESTDAGTVTIQDLGGESFTLADAKSLSATVGGNITLDAARVVNALANGAADGAPGYAGGTITAQRCTIDTANASGGDALDGGTNTGGAGGSIMLRFSRITTDCLAQGGKGGDIDEFSAADGGNGGNGGAVDAYESHVESSVNPVAGGAGGDTNGGGGTGGMAGGDGTITAYGAFVYDRFYAENTEPQNALTAGNGITLTFGASPTVSAKTHIIAHTETTNDVTATTETTLWSFEVPGNALGSDGEVEFHVWCDWQNNSGANRTVTLAIKFGATTLYQDVSLSVATNATRRSAFLRGILKALSTTSQVLAGQFAISLASGATTGTGDLGGEAPIDAPFLGSSSENTTSNKTLTICITNSNTGCSFRCLAASAVLRTP